MVDHVLTGVEETCSLQPKELQDGFSFIFESKFFCNQLPVIMTVFKNQLDKLLLILGGQVGHLLGLTLILQLQIVVDLFPELLADGVFLEELSQVFHRLLWLLVLLVNFHARYLRHRFRELTFLKAWFAEDVARCILLFSLPREPGETRQTIAIRAERSLLSRE